MCTTLVIYGCCLECLVPPTPWKVKGKFALCTPCRHIAVCPTCLNLAIRWTLIVSFTPWLLYFRDKPPVRSEQECMWAAGMFRMFSVKKLALRNLAWHLTKVRRFSSPAIYQLCKLVVKIVRTCSKIILYESPRNGLEVLYKYADRRMDRAILIDARCRCTTCLKGKL
jgi:hypothetical protein